MSEVRDTCPNCALFRRYGVPGYECMLCVGRLIDGEERALRERQRRLKSSALACLVAMVAVVVFLLWLEGRLG